MRLLTKGQGEVQAKGKGKEDVSAPRDSHLRADSPPPVQFLLAISEPSAESVNAGVRDDVKLEESTADMIQESLGGPRKAADPAADDALPSRG